MTMIDFCLIYPLSWINKEPMSLGIIKKYRAKLDSLLTS